MSYGLRPLVKREGPDCLFETWSHAEKERFARLTEVGNDRPLLDHYIQYCVSTINHFLGAVRSKLRPEKWTINEDRKTKGQWLTPTTINGLFICMRQMAAKGHMRGHEYYAKRLTGIDSFSVKNFRSSHWNALGQKLFDEFFS